MQAPGFANAEEIGNSPHKQFFSLDHCATMSTFIGHNSYEYCELADQEEQNLNH